MTLSQTKLLDLVNASNFPLVPLTLENVAVENVQPAEGDGYNTRATIRALENMGYRKSVSVFFRRLPLTVLGEGLSFSAILVTTPQKLLDAINTSRAAWLSLEDFEAFTVPVVTELGASESLTLTAKADSAGWTGSLTVEVALGENEVIPAVSVSNGVLETYDDNGTPKRRAIFTVTLSETTSLVPQIHYTTTGDTAVGGVDYSTLVGDLTFLPGELTKTLAVNVRTTNDPSAERFTMNLSAPVECTIGDGQGECILPAI